MLRKLVAFEYSSHVLTRMFAHSRITLLLAWASDQPIGTIREDGNEYVDEFVPQSSLQYLRS